MLIPLLLTLCCVLAFPSALLGQTSPTARAKDVPLSPHQHDPDIPVLGTEEERAEAKQAEAKEEALKSLFVHERYTVLPIPAIHYDWNESYWAGMVLPILQSNKKGELQDIYAPFYMHNQYVEETVTCPGDSGPG